MSKITQRVNIYKCRFLNINCRHCNKALTGKPCTGKSHGRRYCIPCAIILRIVTRQDCIKAGIEVPLKQIGRLFTQGKITFSQLKEYEISRSELMQYEVVA